MVLVYVQVRGQAFGYVEVRSGAKKPGFSREAENGCR